MFRLNLKIALRNLWKNRGYAFVSIAGLAVALTVFILAMLYVNHESGYDTWNKEEQLVYRLNTKNPDQTVALTPGNMAVISRNRVFAVVASTRIMGQWFGDALVATKTKTMYAADVLQADSNFFKVFQYPVLYGSTEKGFSTLKSIVLSKRYSALLFGEGVNSVGESIKLNNAEGYTVGAVIDTERYPAHFKFNMLYRIGGDGADDFYSNNYYTYVKLFDHSDVRQTETALNQVRKEVLQAFIPRMAEDMQQLFKERIARNSIKLQAVKGIHLSSSDVEYEFVGNGVGRYLYVMLLIASLVLIIAVVNFTNLSVSVALKRTKETGVRKVLGAGKIQIGVQFLLETAIQCVFSLILAMVLVELLIPSFNNVVGTSISFNEFKDYLELLVQLLILLLTVICLAGIYPAIVIGNVIPSAVLKGNFSNSHKGQGIRNTLIVVQFAISVLFICGIWVINGQLDFMQHKDLGYNPQQVLAINMIQSDDPHFNLVKNKLSRIPGVKLISRTDHLPGEDMGGNNYGFQGTTYAASFITVDVDYFKTMGMKLIGGRTFEPNNAVDSTRSLVLTETAASHFNMKNPVGSQVKLFGQDFSVIGLVRDFNHYSPAKSYEPIVFQFMQGNPLHYLIVKIDAKSAGSTIGAIEKEWALLEPGYPVKISFMDEMFEKMLESQSRLKKIISLLSVITIGLALMGLFAVASLATQKRNKEISIRKVLGASVLNILTLLNKGFFKMVLIANLIAWPIAYLALSKWLNSFAFRIEMSCWPFIISGALTLLLTLTIVSILSYKAAISNPVNNLKYE
jgi:putative ABC transport system permease protein